MTTIPEPHEPYHEFPQGVPRWAATAGRTSLTRRLAVRLLGSRRQEEHSGGPAATTEDVPSHVRQRVLRDYHTTNLAHARRASEELVRAGFNTGTVPYGYRAERVRIAEATRRPRWRNRLVIEPVEAAVVKMIFMWRGVEGLSSAAIRRRLAEARYPAPLDPATGRQGVWTEAVVRAILRNPKYTGRQVWGRRRCGRLVSPERWAWSPAWVHLPLITDEEFAAANPSSGWASMPHAGSAGGDAARSDRRQAL